jgi:hypothetical protein
MQVTSVCEDHCETRPGSELPAIIYEPILIVPAAAVELIVAYEVVCVPFGKLAVIVITHTVWLGGNVTSNLTTPPLLMEVSAGVMFPLASILTLGLLAEIGIGSLGAVAMK